MTQVFSWQPSLGVTGSTKFLTRTAQYGDGYSQVVADGINNKADTWPLTFVGDDTKIIAIKAFIDSLQGFRSFYWTPPLRPQGLFRCAGYSEHPEGNGISTLTATFNEVFNP